MTDAVSAGAPIWMECAGPADGPPLVLVHGSLDRSAGMLKLSRQLDDTFRVIRYDRRGYGRSAPSSGPFTIEAQRGDLAEVLRRARVAEPVVLVGHSFGGNVALSMAEHHRSLVRAVVVYESPLSWLAWWPGESSRMAADGWADDPAGAAERFMRTLIGDARWERMPPATQAARRAEGVALVAELSGIVVEAAWHPDRVEVPVLAIAGERGRAHHRRAMEWIAESLPDASAETVDGAAHFGPNTHPEAVATLIKEFMTGRLPVRGPR